MKLARMILIGVLALVLLAPVMAYGLLALANARREPPPPPAWIVGRGDLVSASCRLAVVEAVQPPAEPASDELGVAISQMQARAIADEVLRAHLGFGPDQDPDNVAGPYLLLATLPDGMTRPVWARLWALDNVEYSRNSLVLYLDADTGEPLAIFTDVSLIDPVFAEGCSLYLFEESLIVTPEESALLVMRLEAMLLVVAAVVLGGVWGVRRLLKARARARG